MAVCVALQLVRTPAFRARLSSGIVAALEGEANAYLAEYLPSVAEQLRAKLTFSHEWAGALHYDFIWRSGQVVDIAADLCSYIWRIGVSGGSVDLCTSDTPVIAQIHDVVRPGTPATVKDRSPDTVRQLLVGDRQFLGIEVVLPLTPRVVLLMYHPEHFSAMQNMQGPPLALSTGDVLHCNALQLLHAERQLYASTDQFELLIKHARTFTQVDVP